MTKLTKITSSTPASWSEWKKNRKKTKNWTQNYKSADLSTLPVPSSVFLDFSSSPDFLSFSWYYLAVFNPEFLFIACLSEVRFWKFSAAEMFLALPKRTTIKKTITSFPCTGIAFSVFEFEKIQLRSEKKQYSIVVLSTNKISEC